MKRPHLPKAAQPTWRDVLEWSVRLIVFSLGIEILDFFVAISDKARFQHPHNLVYISAFSAGVVTMLLGSIGTVVATGMRMLAERRRGPRT